MFIHRERERERERETGGVTMIFISLFLIVLSVIREPKDLTWVGYSGNAGCIDMALGTYCTCDYIKIAKDSRCVLHETIYDDASCRDGMFQEWETSHVLWTRVGFACLPGEYTNGSKIYPRVDLTRR